MYDMQQTPRFTNSDTKQIKIKRKSKHFSVIDRNGIEIKLRRTHDSINSDATDEDV